MFRHLLDRIQNRKIPVSRLELLALWHDTEPDVPEGESYKRFSGMVLCGEDDLIKAFLLPGQLARSKRVFRFHCDRFGRSNPVCRRGKANVPLAFARELLIECEVQQQHVQARLSEQTERAGLCIFRNQLLDLLHAYAARPRDARRLGLG